MRKGLGKGLGALLSDFDINDIDNTNSTNNNIDKEEIYLHLIDTNINQPRKYFDETSLTELANSIALHGVLNPITLVRRNNRYMIIAGERRYRAAKIAGLATIPAIIKDYSDTQIREIALIENIQREDLNPIEIALGISELMDKHSYTQEDISTRLGKNRSTVSNYIRLLNLPKSVQSLISENKLSMGHAKCLIVLQDKNLQLDLANKAIEENISVRDFETLIKNYTSNKPKITTFTKPVQQDQALQNIANIFQKFFTTHVSVSGNSKKGKIVIYYYTKNDLERIIECIQSIKEK